MSTVTYAAEAAASPGAVAGPPKLSADDLRAAQAQTLRAPRFRYSIPARLLFFVTDLIYGRQGSVLKFKVLEIVARVPYQAWERAAYAALTRAHRKTRLARRIFDRVVHTRAQQDNEQWHLLIMEELAQRQGLAQPFVRFRLLPQPTPSGSDKSTGNWCARPPESWIWVRVSVRPAASRSIIATS
jgi:ubiquinol oxidase